MSTSKHFHSAVPLILAMVASLFVSPHTAQGQTLPSRAFDVKSGSVQIQGGLLGLSDDVLLFMVLENDTKQTIWAEVEFRLPETGELLQGFEKIAKSDTAMYRFHVPKITWDTEYPFTVSVFEDKKRKTPLGMEESYFFFEGDEDREVFEDLRHELPPGQATVINGFRELRIPSLTAEVPGTTADSLLQADITRKLFAEESKSHKECEHDVLRAEPYERSDPSIIAAGMGGQAQELEGRLRAKGDMLVEKWTLQSCDAVNVYEVLLLRSGAGADIIVKKLD
jgi:hypothetical protein